MKFTEAELSELAMWEDWQGIVARSLPNFCASPIYVQQRTQSQEDFERTAEYVTRPGAIIVDPDGKTRDAEFGGLVRETKACGPVTRMWLDSCVEVDFIMRHLPTVPRVLDIGAGYGRLAVALYPFSDAYFCVDAVPISTEICRSYIGRFQPGVTVLSLGTFVQRPENLKVDLAVNVHSWNECSYAQVARWLQVLEHLRVKYLFTVSNGHLSGGKSAYATWGGKGNSFRPLLEKQYELIAEEEIGLSQHPHALWKLR